jgi:PIN domain nuclease of toxin-antitoxin system
LQLVLDLDYEVVELNAALARRAGSLWQDLRPRGLSLGDRCCLALAEREKLPALTADHRWADFQLGIEIRLFRLPKKR